MWILSLSSKVRLLTFYTQAYWIFDLPSPTRPTSRLIYLFTYIHRDRTQKVFGHGILAPLYIHIHCIIYPYTANHLSKSDLVYFSAPFTFIFHLFIFFGDSCSCFISVLMLGLPYPSPVWKMTLSQLIDVLYKLCDLSLSCLDNERWSVWLWCIEIKINI